MNVVIISTYRSDRGDLDKSLRNLMLGAFTDLGHKAVFVNHDSNTGDIRSSLIVVLGQPKKMEQAVERLHKTNNIVLYNLEPITNSPEYRRMISRCAINPMVKQVWVYNELQLRCVSRSKFIPVGWHDSLLVSSKKTNISGIAFVGSNVGTRVRFIKEIKALGVHVDLLGGSKTGAASGLDKYVVGMDMDHSTHSEKHRWHRMIIHAANRTVFMSTTDWGKYGFVDGKHYIRCTKPIDFVNAAKRFGSNIVLAERMADNLLAKVRSDYSMSDLIEPALSGL
jgi:hypothetical protein